MRHPVYNVRYSVVPINFSLLTITLYFSVRTTAVLRHKIFSPFHVVITEFGCTVWQSLDLYMGRIMTHLWSWSIVICTVRTSEYASMWICVCKKICKSFGYDNDNSKVNDIAAMFEGKFHGLFFWKNQQWQELSILKCRTVGWRYNCSKIFQILFTNKAGPTALTERSDFLLEWTSP
jgi:hypothetical protein